jgi:Xaa-Pro aminopeptidase
MTVESDRDLAGLRRAGRVVALALREMKAALEPGMTTAELDAVGARIIERYGARSAARLVYGFPGVDLISVNDEVVHGVPGGSPAAHHEHTVVITRGSPIAREPLHPSFPRRRESTTRGRRRPEAYAIASKMMRS